VITARIFKKQAKRAVELLRSHGQDVSDYEPSKGGDCIEYPGGWRRLYKRPRHVRRAWDCLAGVPGRWHQTSYEYDEWDFENARNDWADFHYHVLVVPDEFWKTTMSEDVDSFTPWPRTTLKQRRERFSTRQIATGWRWRGGRAVQITKTKKD
jgi:hypothetical protein